MTGSVYDPILTDEFVPTGPARRTAPQAFLAGLRLALHYWPVLLWMLLGTLLVGVLLALLPALSLFELAGRPVMADIADGTDVWQLIDLFGRLAGLQSGEGNLPSSLSMGMLSFWLIALALPLLGGIISAFLYGGVIISYREAPAPFRVGRFFWACWHWFGAFLLLGFVQALLFLFLLLPVAVIGMNFLSRLGSMGDWLGRGLVLLALLLWLMLFETTRVRTVVADRQNPFVGLGQAFGLLFRRPLALVGFYLLALLVWAAVHAIFRLGLLPVAPVEVLPLALFVQQGFILTRLFSRAIRLAGLTALEP